MSLCVPRAMELSKGKGKAICVAKGKKSMLNGDLERTVTFLREKNVGVVIRDERELNQIRMHGEKAKEKAISGGKENAAPKVAPNDNVRSKAQCLRRERERARECIQPRWPASFSSLTPSRRRLACLEGGMTSTSIEIPTNIPKRAMVSHAFESSSVVVLPKTPNLRDYSSSARTPITVDSMLCHHEPQACQHSIPHIEDSVAMPSIAMDEPEMCHPSMPPRNLEEEFLAVATAHAQLLDKELLAMPGTSLAPIHRLPPGNQSIDDELEDESTNIGVDPQANRYLNRHYLGKIKLPSLIAPPLALQELYDGNDERSKSFRHHTREYNATNAFTSLGAKLDTRVLNGRGPLSFTIHGELRHRTGSLLPQPGHEAIYSQLYIYDPESALNARNNRNLHLRRDVLKTIQDCLLTFNPFPEKFLRAFEILNQSESVGQNLPAYLHYSSSTDCRRYNLPTADEIAIILPGDGTEKSGMRDIVLHLRGNNGFMRVNECHPAYLPLHYVLLFPRGELGWEPEMRHWDVQSKQYTDKRLTQMEFYSFRLFQRNSEYSTILRAGKLFQEFIVDAWAATEQNRLNFHRLNQGKIRSELYQDLADIGPDGLGPGQVGKRIILPSSFPGCPRYMFQIFQDSMAITRHNQHPDIFLTMTVNPNWPEITEALLPHQKAVDRPDLVARVFELKRKCLMNEIKKKQVFGKIVGYVYTIEYQKRGLPHMHLLLFLEGPDKIHTCAQVDKVVCAEFPDPIKDPSLFDTVKGCMVHGPCGARNPQAACMENGKCTKKYPKAFLETTTMDQDGYPIYRRRSDGRVYIVRGHPVDNRDVVPYNAYLSRLFNCHINVEVCAGMRCVKYIHKYIYKGNDRATMVLGPIDEIKEYLDARYIGPVEAAWRLFGYSMHEEIPTVVRLALHLPGKHNSLFNTEESMHDIVARAEQEITTLTGFFAYCQANEYARAFTYQEFPQHFVWIKSEKRWKPRERGFAIGRMYFVSPNAGEIFYLSLLLSVVRGPESYECLRTVNNILHDTFKSACIARGLLEDDEEWVQCLEEAAIMKTGYQLRRLFCVILTQCSPSQPAALWDKFAMHICDDLSCKIQALFFIPNPTAAQIEDYGLYLLDELLQESGKNLKDFPPMQLPIGNWSVVVGNRLILEHQQLISDAQHLDVNINVESLNEEQRAAYTAIITSVFENKGTTFFLNGGAGTGKTFLYNTVATKCRSLGHVVVSVASSGIASLLLVGGRTAHSTFSIPLDVLEDSFCSFSKQSLQAELFRKTRLIIWDEVPMQHRYCVEAVDRTLQDICDNNKPFGGITVVLGGDFRQILPVIPKGVREQIVGASLRRSLLWNGMHILTLSLNMRLNSTDLANSNFAEFLNEIGTNPEEVVELPSTIQKCESVSELLFTVYPQLDVVGTITPTFLNERTILSARNDDVSAINLAALNVFPGDTTTYFAADKMSFDDAHDRSITNRYPNEYLNSLNPSGLPPFKLDLKVGCPIMLLRNIAPKAGLCNGTRLMIVNCANRIIEAQILIGDKFGDLVFIPRISLTPSSSEMHFEMTRRQFPIRLAYAMTINKSQGQSVNFVGIDLRTPVFSHGQLYVALSRCTSGDRISVLLSNDASCSTTNIVYPEVLLQ
ncbi:hypothetical protein RHGRI_015221 [Rhododendron griersonianum]|uniref:ATP-dependent DNA helicase n=1 Tax=Rhododendron griersonianum TaxID=479676 RepID=A0AAV6KCG2_9ERIC|nr:hypothetical protein RHGRI_015221 [Rhododendron griersonianum]